jgi:hypothetical protein
MTERCRLRPRRVAAIAAVLSCWSAVVASHSKAPGPELSKRAGYG